METLNYNRNIFSKNLCRLMEQNNMTAVELSKKIGVSQSTVSEWRKGKKAPRWNKLEQIAALFHVQKSDLIEDKSQTDLPDGAFPYNPIMHRIPILGTISAGMPLYAEQNIEGYTYTDLNSNGEYFALRVRGDSMNAARIYEGDILVIRKQDVVEDGDIAVVLVDDMEATVKRFYHNNGTVTLMPQSTNPIHTPQIYDTKKVRIKIVGRVMQNSIQY